MSNLIKKTNRIWDKAFSSPEEKLSRQELAGFHYLPDLVDKDKLKLGTIIDGLDNVKVLHAPDEAYPSTMFYSWFVPGGTTEWTDKRPNGNGKLVHIHIYTLPHWLASALHDGVVTEAVCRKAIERSPGVKEWLADTNYRRPVYMVTGLGVAKENGGPGRRVKFGTHVVIEQWKGEVIDRKTYIIADKLFVAKLVKISCDRPSPEGEINVRIEKYKRPGFSCNF